MTQPRSPLTGTKSLASSALNFNRLSGDGLTTARQAQPSIQIAQYARNGKQPNAALSQAMAQAANQAAMYRTKEVFGGGSAFSGYPSSFGAGDRLRWRFAFHTGPYAGFLWCRVIMRPPTSGTTVSYSRLDLTPQGGSLFSTKFYFGAATFNRYMEALQTIDQLIPIQPDTDYTANWVDVDNGIMISGAIAEIASLTQNYGGYLPENFVGTGPIYAEDRQNLATVANALWRRGGSQVVNFTMDTNAQGGGVSTSSSALSNVPNQTYSLDMTAKARRSQLTTGVPIVMKAYGNNGPGAGGTVALVDQNGNTVIACSSGTWSNAWVSARGTIPATAAQYTLKFAQQGGGTFSLWAASIYEYEL